jgi:hypothetical protein
VIFCGKSDEEGYPELEKGRVCFGDRPSSGAPGRSGPCLVVGSEVQNSELRSPQKASAAFGVREVLMKIPNT